MIDGYIFQCIALAFTVLGVLQWMKNIFSLPKNLSWIWAVSNLVLAVGLAFVFFPISAAIPCGLFSFAITQLMYETLIQGVGNMLKNITGTKSE